MKLKNSAIFFLLLAIIPAIQGCKKSFTDLYNDPNHATSSTAPLIMGGILANLTEGPNTINERRAQYYCSNYSYYGTNDYNLGAMTSYYTTIESSLKMEEAAIKQNLPKVNAYSALSKFFKAYLFTKMSMQVGDIPLSQALQGLGNLTPGYDTQKQVFQQSFIWLEEANADLTTLIAANDRNLSGDFFFNNQLSKWQKLVNTLRLRLLIDLSKKAASDPDLRIAAQFGEIVNNPAKYPVMTDNTDNWQFVYQYPTNKYPSSPDTYGTDSKRFNTSATYIGLLTSLKDPRVFVTAEPAKIKVDAGISPTSFDAFVGADPGISQDLMAKDASSIKKGRLVNGVLAPDTVIEKYSFINRKRYYETYVGEPSIQIGYPELSFNIAEAINLGWITSGPKGNAEAYYQEGISASFQSYNIPASGNLSAYFLKGGSSSGNTYDLHLIPVNMSTYYAQPLVKYAGDPAIALTQIRQQKYLALFRHSGLQSYYNYRRTSVPVFTTGEGTLNSGRIPFRFQYPAVEISSNTANYNAALQRQYGGNDDINAKMWLLQ
ncbi:SusD/RagB family nutrient-binding outer membrane lipoprotein [Pedobacter sp. PAMC26386]|nr:SusD/RagB family nutrient-binding outer membrane lipoprotein [Pedobacter sp. PAMC26386]